MKKGKDTMIPKRPMTQKMLIVLVVCGLAVLLLPAADAWCQPSDLTHGVSLPDQLTLCGEAVPMDLAQVRERFEKEMLLSLWDRPQVVLWLKRAPRYFPYIEEKLEALKLPDDLKYLAVAESALRPHAGSPKGAMGFWQLMPHTARNHGLEVDTYVDERRNLYLATPAALTYLQTLYDKFDSWTMALAAYNMGEEGLAAEVLAQDTKNYYQLYLPLETQRFVFRVLSIKLILSRPETYGFEIDAGQQYKPQVFDSAEVDLFEEIPIQLIAKASHTHFKTIKDLNPHLRGHYVRSGRLRVNLPAGSAKGFESRLKKLVDQHSSSLQQRIYVVQNGDSLSTIADKFDVPLAAILIWNRIGTKHLIHPGDRIILYPRRLRDVKQ
jgi:membrane-bound lytic murein transglycosylase D